MNNLKILNSIKKDMSYVEKNELPNNFINVISLNNDLRSFMAKFINKYPHLFSKMISDDKIFKVGGGKVNDMDKIMSLYSNINKNEIQNRVANIGITLREIQEEIDERTNGIKSFVLNMNQFTSKTLKLISITDDMNKRINDVNEYHSFKFDETDIKQLYIDRNVDTLQLKSKIYNNYLLDEEDSFMLNKMNILKYIVKSPIFNYHIDGVDDFDNMSINDCVDMNDVTLSKTCEGNIETFKSAKASFLTTKEKYKKFLYSYEHHIVLIMTITRDRHEGELYRFIDKSILEEYLKLINDIKETTPKFYERFKFTMNILTKFVHKILSVIDDRVIDTVMINSESYKCDENIKSELNYGFTLLNYFKIILKNIVKK